MTEGKAENMHRQEEGARKAEAGNLDDLVRSYVAVVRENVELKTRDIEERRLMRLTLQQIFEFFKSSADVVEVKITEEEAISTLLRWVEEHPKMAVPNLVAFAELIKVPRRQLDKDRWPEFNATYRRIRDMQRLLAEEQAKKIHNALAPDEEDEDE
jgi:hypothetical protein